MYRHARYTWSDQRCPFFGRNGLFFLRMFKAKPHATDEAAGPGWLERLPREAAMLGCLGLSLFLLVTLASFSPDDPGWSSSGGGAPEIGRASCRESGCQYVLISVVADS